MNSIFAKICSRENISNSLFAKFSSRENKVLYSTLLRKGTHQAERQGVYNCDRANNDIFSRVLGGQKDRREQIACSGDEGATMEKW